MSRLPFEEIEKLSNRRGVKKIAVENFLSTLGNMSYTEACMNLELDARLYGWNACTVDAIRAGIQKARLSYKR